MTDRTRTTGGGSQEEREGSDEGRGAFWMKAALVAAPFLLVAGLTLLDWWLRAR